MQIRLGLGLVGYPMSSATSACSLEDVPGIVAASETAAALTYLTSLIEISPCSV